MSEEKQKVPDGCFAVLGLLFAASFVVAIISAFHESGIIVGLIVLAATIIYFVGGGGGSHGR